MLNVTIQNDEKIKFQSECSSTFVYQNIKV